MPQSGRVGKKLLAIFAASGYDEGKKEGCFVKFYKYCGAGNDFVVLHDPLRALAPETHGALARQLCDRHFGVGADGLMIVRPPERGGDCQMRFYNSDGSAAEMCGNGARCICRFAFESGLSGKKPRIETTAGLVTGEHMGASNWRIRLNSPSVYRQNVCAEGVNCDYVELGEPGIPHAVVWMETLPEADALRALGRKLRFSEAFPRGANVNFCALTGENELRLRTYERGVEDLTLACGTGTGASVFALTRRGLVTGAHTRVKCDGGTLFADVCGEEIYLTGEALRIFTGEIAL